MYIRNFKPQRWPAGPAQKYAKARYDASGAFVDGSLGPEHGGYHDIDACPSLDFLIKQREHPDFGKYLGLSVALRPGEELFDIKDDPDCLVNLAGSPKHQTAKQKLASQLDSYLKSTGDARALGNGDVWETYPRVSGLRWFPEPEWVTSGRDSAPVQEWLDQRRPR